MSANTYLIMAIVFFALSFVVFVVAILLFVKFKVPALIGELSGRTARKQVEEIRKENAANRNKGYVASIFVDSEKDMTTAELRASAELKATGDLNTTGKLKSTGKLKATGDLKKTGKLRSTRKLKNEAPPPLPPITAEIKRDSSYTGGTVLLSEIDRDMSSGETSVLTTSGENDGTSLLAVEAGTTLLVGDDAADRGNGNNRTYKVTILREIIITGSEEILKV